jgi:hypothetical protein
MARLVSFLSLFVSALTVGCTSGQWHEFLGDKPPATSLVPAQTVDGGAARLAAPARAAYPPASGDNSLRVDFIGRKLLNANPQIALQPFFITIGSPDAELFHRGPAELYITEGLEKKCTSEGQLAALLCLELGKMVAEREALTAPQARKPERRPPIEVPMGNAGQFSGADEVRLAELAKFERERAAPTVAVPLPDPTVLARLYLKNAKYPEAELDAVAPLLKEARKNYGLEKQMKSGPAAPSWGPKQ